MPPLPTSPARGSDHRGFSSLASFWRSWSNVRLRGTKVAHHVAMPPSGRSLRTLGALAVLRPFFIVTNVGCIKLSPAFAKATRTASDLKFMKAHCRQGAALTLFLLNLCEARLLGLYSYINSKLQLQLSLAIIKVWQQSRRGRRPLQHGKVMGGPEPEAACFSILASVSPIIRGRENTFAQKLLHAFCCNFFLLRPNGRTSRTTSCPTRLGQASLA